MMVIADTLIINGWVFQGKTWTSPNNIAFEDAQMAYLYNQLLVEITKQNATIARQQEELGIAADLLEAEKAKVARLANDNANQYAELVELRKTAQSLAELEDIAADLANALPNESESPK